MMATKRIRRANRAACLSALLMLAAGCEKGPDRDTIAAQLKSDVEAQLKLMEGADAKKVVSHTTITVTPGEDDHYVVAIEGVKIQPSPEGFLDIGTVSYVATPTDDTHYQVNELKTAPEMLYKTLDGKEQGKFAATTKSFSGLWSRELGTFEKLDAEFADITAKDDQGGDLRLANAKMSGVLSDKGGGLYDSKGTASFSGVAIKDNGGGTFSMADVTLTGNYDSIKLKEYQAAAKSYQELVLKQVALAEQAAAATKNQQGQSTDQAPASLPTMKPEDEKAIKDAIAAMAGALKGFGFDLAIKDAKYADPSGTSPFALAELTIKSLIDGINQDKATLGLDIAHQGLSMDMGELKSPVAEATVPKSGNLGLKMTDVPSKDLAKVLADNLPGMVSANSAIAEANLTAMRVALVAVLQNSGAKIEVTPSHLNGDKAQLTADGSFAVSPQSIYGVVGALNLMLTGLDDLVALAQANPNGFNEQQVLGMAGLLQQYSQREQGADGKPVDKFKIEINEAGQILVNGKPL